MVSSSEFVTRVTFKVEGEIHIKLFLNTSDIDVHQHLMNISKIYQIVSKEIAQVTFFTAPVLESDGIITKVSFKAFDKDCVDIFDVVTTMALNNELMKICNTYEMQDIQFAKAKFEFQPIDEFLEIKRIPA